jgi:lipopolysaccharide transport system permease protein
MASITTSSPVTPLPASTKAATVRIEPPRGWLELRLGEAWQYRELLYFFVWRDVKIRYQQTAIGVIWVVLQPLLTMLVFTLFFGRRAKLPSLGLPYPVFYFAAVVPWMHFASALQTCTNVVVDNDYTLEAQANRYENLYREAIGQHSKVV